MLTIENNKDIFDQRIKRIIKKNEDRTNEENVLRVDEVELILRYQSDIDGNIKCIHCGCIIDIYNMELEHMCSVSKGGTTKLGNVFASCRTCNRSKKDKDLRDYHENDMDKVMDIMNLSFKLSTRTFDQLKCEANYEKPLIIKQRTIEEFYHEIEVEKNELELYRVRLEKKEADIELYVRSKVDTYKKYLDRKYALRLQKDRQALELEYSEKTKDVSALKRDLEKKYTLERELDRRALEVEYEEKTKELKKLKNDMESIYSIYKTNLDEIYKLGNHILEHDADGMYKIKFDKIQKADSELSKYQLEIACLRDLNIKIQNKTKVSEKDKIKIKSLQKRVEEFSHIPHIREKYKKQLDDLLQ